MGKIQSPGSSKFSIIYDKKSEENEVQDLGLN